MQEHSTSEDRPGFIANRILMPYINEARCFDTGCIGWWLVSRIIAAMVQWFGSMV
jgi:3-hydroxyacyl-CoA dehydrogenase